MSSLWIKTPNGGIVKVPTRRFEEHMRTDYAPSDIPEMVDEEGFAVINRKGKRRLSPLGYPKRSLRDTRS
jgi:hypothetical protein